MKHRHSSGETKRIAWALGVLVVLFPAVLMFGYNTFQDNLGTVSSPVPEVPRWSNLPVEWLLNPAVPSGNVATPNCSNSSAACIQTTLADGFTTWEKAQVAGKTLTDLLVNYGGEPPVPEPTSPNAQDCQNVIGFSDTTSSDFPTGVIAFTQVATVTASSPTNFPFQYSCSGGTTKTCNYADCLADADIEFNPNENFTTSSTPPSGTFSLLSVATHEEGHFLGLDHSGIAHTVMFPFGDTTSAGQQTTLSTDDDIGISYLYPCTATSTTGTCTGSFSKETGTITGKVSLSGSGIFGSHVVVVNSSTGTVVTDRLTDPNGNYSIVGVPPGSYNVLALPLAPNSDAGVLTLDNFSGWECGYADSTCSSVPQNPTSYTGRYH